MGNTELLTGGGVAGIVAHLLTIARERGWITNVAQHRIFAALAALITSLGMQFTFDAGTGAWVLSGTLTGLAVGLLHAIGQYGVIDFFVKQWARIKLDKMFEGGS